MDTADELAIRSLVARYGDAVCRRDAQAWGDTWAPDATWALSGDRLVHGRDDIVALWREAIKKYPWVAQLPASGFLEVVDGEVHGTWYVFELNHLTDGRGVMDFGRYSDTYVKTDGEWHFAARRLHIVYRGAMDPGTVTPLVTGS